MPVVLPDRHDPRLHLAAVIVCLQVLGQVGLGFELSVAQILVAVGAAAVVELVVAGSKERALVWPASALLTGNGVAFILRVPGTVHGDWWSMRGAGIFAATAAGSVVVKHLVRVGGRPLFNPSNIGLVACFLLLGTARANPQDLWWGTMSPALVATLVVIAVGGLTIVVRMRMVGLAASFWLSFTVAVAAVARSGHCMTARWHVGAVCGPTYWWVLATSPEVLVFMFFMITDPKTAPSGRKARLVYGVGVGGSAAVLAAQAGTEFGTKVAILGALTLLCALRPVLERVLVDASAATRRRPYRPMVAVVAAMSVIGGSVALAGAPARSTPVVAAMASEAVVPATVPTPSIGPGVTAADPSLTPTVARAMSTALAGDLSTAADAVRRHDPALAATCFTGAALGWLKGQVAGGPSGVRVDLGARLRAITVVLVPDDANPQGSPAVGLRTSTGTGPDRVWVLSDVGGRWLVASGSVTGR